MTGRTAADAGLADRYALARAAGDEAARLTLRYFQSAGLTVERKADASPVTRADREAEALLRERIEAAFPEDGILGEEFGEKPGAGGFRWILDPIDGTQSFIHGVPLYGSLIGVERVADRRSVIGVLVLPALGETVHACAGGGAWFESAAARQPVPARVSEVAALEESLVCYTSVKGFDRGDERAAFQRMKSASRLLRGWGDCYGHALVATGRAEAMVEPVMHVWDCAALQPILEEAGGRCTDWSGAATIHSGNLIGSNGRVHGELLGLIAG
jgi:histidinol phosphatase-like enzyme (inositol monophosphatase family)